MHYKKLPTTNKSKSLNGTILHNGEGNPLPTLVDVVLGEYEGAILRDEVTVHAGEYPTVKS